MKRWKHPVTGEQMERPEPVLDALVADLQSVFEKHGLYVENWEYNPKVVPINEECFKMLNRIQIKADSNPGAHSW